MKRVCVFVVLHGLAVLAAARGSRADSFNVSLNTSSLSGTQALIFEFTDGDGVVDNSVALTNFSLGGGSVAGSADYLGTTGVSGDIGSGIDMDDGSLSIALFSQNFNPGATLSFLLTTTNNYAGGSPDGFVMAICDTGLDTCYSDDPDGADLVLPLNGAALVPASFTLTGASAQGLPAPVVTTPSSGTVPEPSGVLLLGAGIFALAIFQRKRRSPNALVG
jgi:hypothetical protein